MSTYLVNQSWLLNLRQTGVVVGIWKGSSFYSASMSAKIKRLRRVEIRKDVELDYFFKSTAGGQVGYLTP
jgi:hypothetical protein